ncbi:MAG: hypothetical protein AAB400_03490 [Patescibacteria group bacterium]
MKRGTMVGVAAIAVGVIGGAVGYYYTTQKPPPVAAVVQPKPEMPAMPEGVGGVIVKGIPVNTNTKPQVKKTEVVSDPLPPKFNDKGQRMYVDIRWKSDLLAQIIFLGPHLGVVPGKGFCKLMPLVVSDPARPFANTEGKWTSTNPPTYELWPRDGKSPLPKEFRPVYVRNGKWYFADLERGYINDAQVVVVKPLPGAKNQVAWIQIGPKAPPALKH